MAAGERFDGQVLSTAVISSERVVDDILEQHNISADRDVEVIYLANKGLTGVHDLCRFQYLGKLWLNGNKLRQISCLRTNYRICELYLNNNELVTISGALGHLTCLQICLLHNNQLTKLDTVTREFRKMLNLRTLNLFGNPVAQEADYRLFVIKSCPYLQLLDRQEITKREREIAHHFFTPVVEKCQDKIAFGRRSQGPPSLYFPATPSRPTTRTSVPEGKEPANNYMTSKPVIDDIEEAVNTRRLKKSLTMYTSFDWTKVPRLEERRTSEAPFGNPVIITRIYR